MRRELMGDWWLDFLIDSQKKLIAIMKRDEELCKTN